MSTLLQRTSRGFTLIELLVVIGVIAVLSSIVYASVDGARRAARDDARKADLKELQLAVELYKAQYGVYPPACSSVSAGSPWAGSETYSSGAVVSCPNDYIVGLVPNFIPALPREPGSTKYDKGYVYRVTASGQSYKIMSHHNVESDFTTSVNDEFYRYAPVCGSFAAAENDVYAVYGGTTFGQCW